MNGSSLFGKLGIQNNISVALFAIIIGILGNSCSGTKYYKLPIQFDTGTTQDYKKSTQIKLSEELFNLTLQADFLTDLLNATKLENRLSDIRINSINLEHPLQMKENLGTYNPIKNLINIVYHEDIALTLHHEFAHAIMSEIELKKPLFATELENYMLVTIGKEQYVGEKWKTDSTDIIKLYENGFVTKYAKYSVYEQFAELRAEILSRNIGIYQRYGDPRYSKLTELIDLEAKYELIPKETPEYLEIYNMWINRGSSNLEDMRNRSINFVRYNSNSIYLPDVIKMMAEYEVYYRNNWDRGIRLIEKAMQYSIYNQDLYEDILTVAINFYEQTNQHEVRNRIESQLQSYPRRALFESMQILREQIPGIQIIGE